MVFAGAGDDLIYARDTEGVDYIGCGPGFEQRSRPYTDTTGTLSNCERAIGPRQGGI